MHHISYNFLFQYSKTSAEAAFWWFVAAAQKNKEQKDSMLVHKTTSNYYTCAVFKCKMAFSVSNIAIRSSLACDEVLYEYEVVLKTQ